MRRSYGFIGSRVIDAVALDDLHRHLASQTLQALRALLAVVFGIDRQADVLIERVVQHERTEVLNRVERVAAAADDRAHVRAGQLKTRWSHSTCGRTVT